MDKKIQTKDMVMTGMFATVLAVLSQLSIPLPTGVPVTLQTFAVPLCGYVLGWKKGTASTAVYLLLGAVGLPVFAGFKGGLASLLGMTGGFLFGFLLLALFAGTGMEQKNRVAAVLMGALGVLADHTLGVLWYAIVSGNSLWQAFLLVSFPYLLKDMISVVLAYGVALAVRQGLYAVSYR